MNAKEKVFKFIDQRLEYVKLVDVPHLPGGTMAVMENGSELLVSYDFMSNEIVEHLPDGDRRTPWFIVSGDDPHGYYPAGVFEQNSPDKE